MSADSSREELTVHGRWNWHPALPIQTSPLFRWPFRPREVWLWLSAYWLKLSMVTIVLLLAIAYWLWLQPPAARCARFELHCWGAIYLRNVLLFVLVAGGLHAVLYRYAHQNSEYQFDAQGVTRADRRFTFGNQLHDNVFWSLASGVTVWSCYDLLYAIGSARGWYPTLAFDDSPLWFVALFPLILIWASAHFFAIHKLLHLKWLYKNVHAIHHRNISVGPWSGISMHPAEHLLYFSGVLVHLWLPSHPVHVFFHILGVALYPIATHSGFERLLFKNGGHIALGSFYHQLHHRYFNCNYGTVEVPIDRWIGTYHDGSEQHSPLRQSTG